MYKRNSDRAETHGTAATTSSTIKFDSGARIQMATTQAGQAIVPAKSDLPRILTGHEKQLSDYTFAVRAPENIEVVAVINKFRSGIGFNSVNKNSLTTVIYHTEYSNQFGVLHLEGYRNQSERVHETFGFKYVQTQIAKELHPGQVIFKGTLLAASTNVTSHSYSTTKVGGREVPEYFYATGLSVNVANIAVPYTTEDGVEVSESFIERATPTAIGSRVAEWGKVFYPLFLYKDPMDPKIDNPFPEMGQKIREDGLVFALRKHDHLLGGLQMTREALLCIDYKHDELVYGVPGAEVVDITVDTTTKDGKKFPHTPKGMERQAAKYEMFINDYYDTVLNVYHDINRREFGNATYTPELLNLITRANGHKPNTTNRRLNDIKGGKNSILKSWRAVILDEWRVEIVYAWKFPMGEGSKISDRHGCKGVICKVRPDHEMPVDDFGNRADCLVFGKAGISRLDPGLFYEQYINACSRDITLDIISMLNKGDEEAAWNHFLTYIQISAKSLYDMVDPTDLDDRARLFRAIRLHGMYLGIDSCDENLGINIFFDMEGFRPPNKSQLTYTTVTGERVRTKLPILIGEKDMIVLDKSDHKPMAVSGIGRQHHGCPAVENRSTKHSTPSKEQPPRVLGETDVRFACATMGGQAVANIMEDVNNPDAHRELVMQIFNALDHSKIQRSEWIKNVKQGRRPLEFVKHIGECAGWKLIEH